MNKYETASTAASYGSYGKAPPMWAGGLPLRADEISRVQWPERELRFRCSYCGTTFKSEPEKCEQCGARKFEVTR